MRERGHAHAHGLPQVAVHKDTGGVFATLEVHLDPHSLRVRHSRSSTSIPMACTAQHLNPHGLCGTAAQSPWPARHSRSSAAIA